MNIGYLSETDQDYSNALKKVEKYQDLIDLLEEYKPIAFDAYNAVKGNVSEKSFPEFHRKLKRTRFAKSDKDYDLVCGIVLMPEVMFKVSMIAAQFTVPFGTAFIRLKDVGKIVEENGHYLLSVDGGKRE